MNNMTFILQQWEMFPPHTQKRATTNSTTSIFPNPRKAWIQKDMPLRNIL